MKSKSDPEIYPRDNHTCINMCVQYLSAAYVPNNPAALIPTANPIINPILTRSKQLTWCPLCIALYSSTKILNKSRDLSSIENESRRRDTDHKKIGPDFA